jgi:hypothetical protein
MRIAVAVGSMAVHNVELAGVRLEPDPRDAAAVVAAVGVGRGEVNDGGPLALNDGTGGDIEADSVVERDAHIVKLCACHEIAVASKHETCATTTRGADKVSN